MAPGLRKREPAASDEPTSEAEGESAEGESGAGEAEADAGEDAEAELGTEDAEASLDDTQSEEEDAATPEESETESKAELAPPTPRQRRWQSPRQPRNQPKRARKTSHHLPNRQFASMSGCWTI